MAIASYTINGKFDKKPISQARVQFAKLNKSMKAISIGLKGFAIAKAMQIGANAINGATDAYREQEMQLKRLSNAVRTNANLTNGAFDRLQDQVSQLSDAAIFSGEDLTKGQAYLASMKLNEEQIKKVMTAATNLASAGVMPLDGAVKNLSKTFAGEVGELKDLNPALANLTEEQFKNGEAVAIIANQYKGFNEIMANSEHGKALQFANSFDDLRKTIGEIIQSIKNISFSKMLTPLRNITTKLKENKDKIINFFRYLPEIALLSFDLIKKMISKLISFKGILFSFNTLISAIVEIFLSSWRFVGSFIKVVGAFIWEPLKQGFNVVIFSIKKTFGTVVNFFINKINWLIKALNNISGALGLGKMGLLKQVNFKTEKPKNEIAKNIDKSISNLKDTYKREIKNISNTVKDTSSKFRDYFGDEFTPFFENVDKILNKQNTTEKDVSGQNSNGTNDDNPSPTTEKKESIFASLKENVKGAGGAISWMANVAEKFAEKGNPMVILVEVIKIALQGLIEILAPIVNSLLKPLFGIVRTLGKFLGIVLIPILKMLEPVIRLVSKAFLYIYNYVLRPIGNALIFMFNLIYNGFVGFMNGLRKLVKIITFGAVDLGHTSYRSLDEGMLNKLNESHLVQEGDQALGNSAGANSSANASAGISAVKASKPTEVNVHFTNSFVNGDAREIALMLKKEINTAEKMGA